jgi:hypothetical protein
MPEDSSAGSVPLIQIENKQTRRSNDSTDARNMYIHPVYAVTKITDSEATSEYEEIT